jgi:hypothetical protein
MDDSDIKKTTTNRSEEKEIKNCEGGILNDGNVFSSVWIRRTIQARDGSNWFLLGRRHRFLLNFRLLLAIVYIIVEILK